MGPICYCQQSRFDACLMWTGAMVIAAQIIVAVMTILGKVNGPLVCYVNLGAVGTILLGRVARFCQSNAEGDDSKLTMLNLYVIVVLMASFVVANGYCLAGKWDPKVISWITISTPLAVAPIFLCSAGCVVCSQ